MNSDYSSCWKLDGTPLRRWEATMHRTNRTRNSTAKKRSTSQRVNASSSDDWSGGEHECSLNDLNAVHTGQAAWESKSKDSIVADTVTDFHSDVRRTFLGQGFGSSAWLNLDTAGAVWCSFLLDWCMRGTEECWTSGYLTWESSCGNSKLTWKLKQLQRQLREVLSSVTSSLKAPSAVRERRPA